MYSEESTAPNSRVDSSDSMNLNLVPDFLQGLRSVDKSANQDFILCLPRGIFERAHKKIEQEWRVQVWTMQINKVLSCCAFLFCLVQGHKICICYLCKAVTVLIVNCRTIKSMLHNAYID